MPGLGHRLALWLAVAVIAVSVVAMATAMRAAALPPEASGKMLVVFEPGTGQDEIFGHLIEAGGSPVRRTWLPFVWVVASDTPGFAGTIMAKGALGAYDELPFSPQLAGCFAYVDAKAMKLFALQP
ncbi:MAG TPA: hypothetical protein VK844_01930 [Hyphomicrobiales bacterium]|nr:hypothetical protein [Hyphomicrobiales bacterium]